MDRPSKIVSLSFFAIVLISCSEISKQRIIGNWSCKGEINNVDVDVEAQWTFASSGELSSQSELSFYSDEDLDGDGMDSDKIRFSTIEKGVWSVSNNGYLETKTNESNLLKMTIDRSPVAAIGAQELHSLFTSAAIDVPVLYKIVSIKEDTMSLSLAGETVECER